MKKLAILFFFITSVAFAAIPWDIPSNDMKFGDGTTSAQSFEMKMGLGASNPIFSSANGTDMEINIPFKVGGNAVTIGDGTAQDLNIDFDINGTADIPSIKYDNAVGSLVFKSKVGDTFKKFGSGGAGGGENYNNAFVLEDKNPNGEDGKTGWTESAGTFAMNTSDPLEGEQSFEWTPAAQNNTLDSSVLDFDKNIFEGRACEASIEYIGGDTNLDLLVVDGNGLILNPLKGTASTEGNNRTLPVHTISAKETVSFICPSDADITGDSLKGDIKLQIKNVGASASALIKWDKSYLGTLQALSESTLPDVLTAYVDTAGNVTKENVDWIDGNCTPSVGTRTCSIISGLLTESPNCTMTVKENSNSETNIKLKTSGATAFVINTQNSAGTNTAYDFNITCIKTGADAKQTVQVYKAIPKVSENENVFHVVISGGVVVSSNVDIISGITNWATVGPTVSFNAGVFTVPPAVTCATQQTSGSNVDIHARVVLSNQFNLEQISDTGSQQVVTQDLSCVITKQGVDYKTAGIQNISLGGLVVNSYAESNQKNIRTEGCRIDVSGAPSINNESGLCGWIDSLTDQGVGRTDINFVAGTFSDETVCSCSTLNAGFNCAIIANTSSTIRVLTEDKLSATDTDADYYIQCKGAR